MRKAVILVRWQVGKDFNVLPLVHLEVSQHQAAVLFINLKGFFVTEQFAIIRPCFGQAADLKRNVRDPDDQWLFRRLSLNCCSGDARNNQDKEQQEYQNVWG